MAARYFITGGVDSKWSTSGNWSATDGGGASGVKPTASDDVFFTSNSPACTVDTAGVGLTLNFTGYTNTITMTAGLTISGSVTLVAAMTIAGASQLSVIATATLTSNGKTWPNALQLSGTATFTLADDWDVDGTLIHATGTTTINGQTLYAGAGWTLGSTATVQGTTLIALNGTGTLAGQTVGSGILKNSFTFNTAGTITIGSGSTVAYSTGTITYTAGTVVTTNSTLFLLSAGATLACNGMVWNNVTFTGSVTHTLNENLNVSGLATLGATTNTTVLNGNTLNASGGVTFGCTSGTFSGTTIVAIIATGTLAAPSITTGRLSSKLNLNAPGGTITVTSVISLDFGQVLFTAGTVTTTYGTWAQAGGGSEAVTIFGG